jgi:hypothetical protein
MTPLSVRPEVQRTCRLQKKEQCMTEGLHFYAIPSSIISCDLLGRALFMSNNNGLGPLFRIKMTPLDEEQDEDFFDNIGMSS